MSKGLNTALLLGRCDTFCLSLFKLPAGCADTQTSMALEPSGLKMQAPGSPPSRLFGRKTSVAGGWAVFRVCLRQWQDCGLDPVQGFSN